MDYQEGQPEIHQNPRFKAHSGQLNAEGWFASKVVLDCLGHTNIGITLDIYNHVMPGMQRAAVERCDRIFEPDTNENSDPNASKLLNIQHQKRKDNYAR